MKILMAASEAVPYCKTGGLADVAGALPHALAQRGHNVHLILPLYRDIDRRQNRLRRTPLTLRLPVGSRWHDVALWRADPRPRLQVLFIDAPGFFDREGIYGPRPHTEFADNAERFALFSRAVLEASRATHFRPDIFHGHDWQTGLVCAHLRTGYADDPFFKKTATVFSIHNMAYQGNFSPSALRAAGLRRATFTAAGVEYYGGVSYLKAGIMYTDMLSTVSPTYAFEIQSSAEFGFGMESLVRGRAARMRGILNGLDTAAWDPHRDPHIAARYRKTAMIRRARCKTDLQKTAGFTPDDNMALLGFIGRLDPQKGVDMLLEILPPIVQADHVQFVALGQGRADYDAGLRALADRFPGRVFFENRFAEPLAHQIYAGADMFLMPSRYEPCGLGQMIAMRYGCVPLVTPTGGLLDTVQDASAQGGTGFVAEQRSAAGFREAVVRALAVYQDRVQWRMIQQNAMAENHAWGRSIRPYVRLYEEAIAWHR